MLSASRVSEFPCIITPLQIGSSIYLLPMAVPSIEGLQQATTELLKEAGAKGQLRHVVPLVDMLCCD
jgi:hypothetical protein